MARRGTRRARRASRTQRKRRASRASRRGRKQRGGSAPVGSYNYGMLSDRQGAQFQAAHINQHGGAAPVGYTGVMDDPALRLSARVTPLDDAMSQIQGMRDGAAASPAPVANQTGGARRRGRKGKKARKGKSKKTRRGSKRRGTRRMRGGAYQDPSSLSYGPATGPGMLLSPSMAARAGLNAEWDLAKNPNSFRPL